MSQGRQAGAPLVRSKADLVLRQGVVRFARLASLQLAEGEASRGAALATSKACGGQRDLVASRHGHAACWTKNAASIGDEAVVASRQPAAEWGLCQQEGG